MSDGFLGDVLKLHVICTINCPVGKLDRALLRPGRMLAYREFRRLPMELGQALAAAKQLSTPVDRDLSLAELYNSRADNQLSNSVVGFQSLIA